MAAEEIHLNDIGTIFELTVKDGDATLDISTALSMVILFKKPSGTVVTQTAVYQTDGTDGIMQYVTQTGDLDEVGGWKIQGRVQLPTGHWSSDTHSFKVYANLD